VTAPPRFGVVLAGGGTTGHVGPLLATADALLARCPGRAVVALGTAEGLEARLVPEHGLPLRVVPRVPMPRRAGTDLVRLPGRLGEAVGAARAAIDEVAGTAGVARVVVVGFGGYVAAPAYLAARRAGAAIVVHEANSRPGLANRLGARLTPHVATAFPGTPLPGARHLGLPMRRAITRLDRGARRAEALARFGLAADHPTLLVTGGSLGARRLNDTVAATAGALAGAGAQVLHLTGAGKAVSPDRPAGAPPYVALEYLDRMDLAYAAADLVLCRAGAGTVSEVTAVGLPAVYVPLPVGNGEQRLNAAPVVDAGGGLLVADSDLTPSWLTEHAVPLLRDRGRLAAMAAAAAGFGIADGDERLCDLVEAAAGGAP
jgi:UDP-N-acetylglucosamine--N-acetylmuramyl-(pentapeptide) pyrophosphoryl-undecaprenol N-acetylglucosamine transferase